MPCHGNGDDHCCWLPEPCEFLQENVAGRRWSCVLRRKLPSWDAVHKDPRYLRSKAHAVMAELYPGFECGDYPDKIPEAMSVPGGKCCYG